VQIGRFARLTGLTVKALHHYDEIGRLRPADVDADTGYRSYASEQVERAEAIRLLRKLEIQLDEIAKLLDDDDPALQKQVLVDHHDVAEAAVCSRKDATTGEAIVAYVTLKGGKEGSVEKLAELRDHVAKKIGPIAKPANIVFTPELPKTRSGKIMRRLLRDVAENRPLGDTTTLADPTVVSEIQNRATSESSEES